MRLSVIRWIAGILHKEKIYMIGDLHLEHKNIIRYCHRPFKSVSHMNDSLLKNWNGVVRGCDKVYFLGDLVPFKPRKIGFWIKRLNGKKIIIKGNHDGAVRNGYFRKIVNYNDMEFLLVHDPQNIPKSWNGWTIHGHKHNNNMKEFPLINSERKTINVSCELIHYKPITLEKIYQMARNHGTS